MAERRSALRRVLVLNTGGTIGMQSSPNGYVCGPPGFLSSFCQGMPIFHDSSFEIDEPSSDDVPVLVTPVSEFGTRALFKIVDYEPLIDSSNMTSSDWLRIARDVLRFYDHWDAFVVLHGTDTVAYTCAALSFMLQNLNKTIIFTGAQIPLSRPRSDGVGNFCGALLMASRFDIPEVCFYFADKLYRGNRTTKVNASGLQAFDSPNMSPLASMGISCSVRWDLIRQPSVGKLTIVPGFCDDVVIIRIYPGPFTTMRNTLKPPLRGAILLTFGAGNAPDKDPSLIEALREANDRGVVIVNVTQCQSGTVEPHYATGQALAAVGVIAGRDMTVEAALVKLGWLLASGRDVAEIRSMMSQDLQGEVSLHRNMQFSLYNGEFIRSVFSSVKDPQLEDAPAKMESRHSLRKGIIPTLMCAAAASGDIDVIREMVAEGAAVDSADYDGRTALHLAAAEGHQAVVRYLISQGISISALDRWGNSPLSEAASHRRIEIVKMLAEAGAKLHLAQDKLATILCSLAHARDHSALVCYAAARADFSACDYDRRTALHVAAGHGDTDIVTLLLESGADANSEDRWGRTPLEDATTPSNPHDASTHVGHSRVAELLRNKRKREE